MKKFGITAKELESLLFTIYPMIINGLTALSVYMNATPREEQ